MSLVAQAVYNTFKPRKLNYELLGNTDNHMHWHIFPRYKNAPMPNRTVWNIDKKIREAHSTKPSQEELRSLKFHLKKELDKLLKKSPR